MRRLFCAIFILTIFIVACNNKNPNAQTDVVEVSEHDHAHAVLEELSLNDGEKWEMQEELLQNISNMEMAIKDANGKDSVDYSALTKIIDKETKQMISSCTMKGQSHIELHKWLEPHLAMIKDLNASADMVESAAIISEIDESFVLLRKYFE